MLKIEKFVTPSPEQWEIIIEGMRNPKNSWDRMDSFECRECDSDCRKDCPFVENPTKCPVFTEDMFILGPNDHKLMMQLADGGPVHAKYRRMIDVFVTINAPLYWWKEFDTYKVGTVCNSCSTMHKIHAKEFTLEDFSYEHLFTVNDLDGFYYSQVAEEEFGSTDVLNVVIEALNEYRKRFLDCGEKLKRELTDAERKHVTAQQKRYWWQMIQLLPTSYNQKRTIKLNYEVLHNIYTWRRNHKLDEWHAFCDWIEELPYSELIVGEREEKSDE